MTESIVCNVCERPGSLQQAKDRRRVACNVRAFSDEEFTIWRCDHCASLHCQEHVDLDRYYERYPVKAHRLDFWARLAYAEYLRRLSQAGVRPVDRVLDFGCGPGLLIQFLRQRGFAQVSGYDAHVAEFANETVLAQQYDVVISQDVIEHAEDPATFLAQLVGLVKSGCVLCIGTPNADGIDLSRPDEFSLSLHAPYHRHILSESALLRLASQLGLKPVAVHRRFYYDTLFPTVNFRFLKTYVRKAGNTLDAAFEEPKFGLVARSPALWFYAIAGYLFPPRSEMMIIFKRD